MISERALDQQRAQGEIEQKHSESLKEMDSRLSEKDQEIARLQIQLQEKDKYISWYGDSQKQQAEIDSDTRIRDTDLRIKQFLSQEVMPYLKQEGDAEAIELTRRFCDLQLQLDSMKQLTSQQDSQIKADASKIVHLEKAMVELKFGERASENEERLKIQVADKDKELRDIKYDLNSFNKGLASIDSLIHKIEGTHGLGSQEITSDTIQLQA